MTKMTFSGPWRYRGSGYGVLMRLGVATAARHAAGHRLDPSWGLVHEIGVRFWRHQFTRALTRDIREGRKLFDAVQTRTGPQPAVTRGGAATGAPLFKPVYRLTPEHRHPAQQEDALAAVRWALNTVPPDRLVLVGESAGGHLVLMTRQALRAAGLPQPALAVGLSPWTDIAPGGGLLQRQ